MNKNVPRTRLPNGQPHPIDLAVGRRLKAFRKKMHISQQNLADRVGITFQQIQKYENGQNRIGASRLWDIAQALNIPIHSFFEPEPKGWEDIRTSLSPTEGILLNDFRKIQDPTLVQNVLNLVKSLAESDQTS